MTSSLVGSEMCIRDSGQPLGQEAGGSKAFDRWVLGLGRSSFHQGQDAVSYTHLTLPTICSV
eukprot:5660480-Prorocentrum_lima.AAC.1